MSFVANTSGTLNQYVVDKLKEIGRQKQHRDLTARVIVGLESGDPLIMNEYNQLVDSLEPNLREKLCGAVINV